MKKLQMQKSKITQFWVKSKKALIAAGVAVSGVLATALPAAAATINENATTASVVGGILDVVFKVAFYMGFIIAAIGLVSFLIAMKDDNAESQSRGARLMVVGAILIGMPVIVKLTGLIK